MSTLPVRVDLDQLRRQAKDLLRAARDRDADAAARIHAVSDEPSLRHTSRSPASTASPAGRA
jgi:hypothetical protein